MPDRLSDATRLNTEELVELSTIAAEIRDPVLATVCWLAAKRRRSRHRDAILAPLLAEVFRQIGIRTEGGH